MVLLVNVLKSRFVHHHFVHCDNKQKESIIQSLLTLSSHLSSGMNDISTSAEYIDERNCQSLATLLSTITLLSSNEHDYVSQFATIFLERQDIQLLLHYLSQLPQECMDSRVSQYKFPPCWSS